MELPPLNLNLSANPRSDANGYSALDFSGASFAGSGPGDWNVNFAPGGSAGGVPLLWIVLAVGAAWMIFKK